MGSEIAIAVVFFGVILLAICAAAFKSMAKIFVGVIGALGAYLIIMTWAPVILAPALIVALIVWLVVIQVRRVRSEKARGNPMYRSPK